MDTELLRTFLEVRTTRHFGRAADNLFITQAAVSARIKQLEEALGAPLFVRTRNNIQLSREGERLVPHAETMLLALARARQEVQLGDSQHQRLVIGVRSGIWRPALQARLNAVAAERPLLSLAVESQESTELQRKLLDRSIDIALLHDPPAPPELEVQAVGELNLRLFSTHHRGSARAAMEQGHVYLDWGQGFAHFHARHFSDHAPPRLRTNLVEVATGFLAEQGGACYLPVSMKRSLAELNLAPVRGAPSFSRPLNLVFHSGTTQPDLIAAVARGFNGLKL